uniref:Nucleolus and neural progenitor protein-like N-terminal domain-containing protein n=1 Tax=Triticum urartu TaxID=4572 RepID=A0A8R7Q8V5_TRIUA
MAATRPEGSAEEHRMRAALRHLQAEAGVLERLVYKHRNQHRGAAYFQYLLKVRRDEKLLLGANLMEVISAVFPVITCRKPANTILVPNRQGKRKPGANHCQYKRLLGVARLLSQLAEPVMKGAVYPFLCFVVFLANKTRCTPTLGLP